MSLAPSFFGPFTLPTTSAAGCGSTPTQSLINAAGVKRRPSRSSAACLRLQLSRAPVLGRRRASSSVSTPQGTVQAAQIALDCASGERPVRRRRTSFRTRSAASTTTQRSTCASPRPSFAPSRFDAGCHLRRIRRRVRRARQPSGARDSSPRPVPQGERRLVRRRAVPDRIRSRHLHLHARALRAADERRARTERPARPIRNELHRRIPSAPSASTPGWDRSRPADSARSRRALRSGLSHLRQAPGEAPTRNSSIRLRGRLRRRLPFPSRINWTEPSCPGTRSPTPSMASRSRLSRSIPLGLTVQVTIPTQTCVRGTPTVSSPSPTAQTGTAERSRAATASRSRIRTAQGARRTRSAFFPARARLSTRWRTRTS